MVAKRLLIPALMATIFGAGYLLGTTQGDLVLQAEASAAPVVQTAQVFELRTYTAADGKIDDLPGAFPEPHAQDLREARHDERRVLDAAGRAALAEHADLHARTSFAGSSPGGLAQLRKRR